MSTNRVFEIALEVRLGAVVGAAVASGAVGSGVVVELVDPVVGEGRVHGHREVDGPAQRLAEHMLEPGSQPALQLGTGEVVGPGHDRRALVQRDRPAGGEPRPLVGGQVVDQALPVRTELS